MGSLLTALHRALWPVLPDPLELLLELARKDETWSNARLYTNCPIQPIASLSPLKVCRIARCQHSDKEPGTAKPPGARVRNRLILGNGPMQARCSAFARQIDHFPFCARRLTGPHRKACLRVPDSTLLFPHCQPRRAPCSKSKRLIRRRLTSSSAALPIPETATSFDAR